MVSIRATASMNTQVKSVSPLVQTTNRTSQPVISSVAPQINSSLSSASTIVATTIALPKVVRPIPASYFDPIIDFMVRKSLILNDSEYKYRDYTDYKSTFSLDIDTYYDYCFPSLLAEY